MTLCAKFFKLSFSAGILALGAASSAEDFDLRPWVIEGAPLIVHAFDRVFRFPWTCAVIVRPSVVAAETMISCDSLS